MLLTIFTRSKIVFLVHVFATTIEHIIFCIPLMALKISICKVLMMINYYAFMETTYIFIIRLNLSIPRGMNCSRNCSLKQRMKFCQTPGMIFLLFDNLYPIVVTFKNKLFTCLGNNMARNHHTMSSDNVCLSLLQARPHLVNSP